MTTSHGADATLLHDLRLSLEALGDALARGDLAELLPIEDRLAGAVDRLPALLLAARDTVEHPIERADLAARAGAVAEALRRCRRLGAGLGEVVRATLEAQGRTAGYDRAGTASVDARTGALDARG
jgi:hypothetical protein